MPDDTTTPAASDDTPQRRFTIEMSVGGDTLEDALSMVRHFAENVRNGTRSSVSGGYSQCGILKVVVRPDVTHDSHAAALERWIEAHPSQDAAHD